MILGFKTHFKDGTPTNFRSKILNGIKQTTIREDRGERYKVGTKLHFATGVRTKNYEQFAEGIVTESLKISICPSTKSVKIFKGEMMFTGAIDDLVKMEGFDSEKQFWKWFNKPLSGKLIHWRLFK